MNRSSYLMIARILPIVLILSAGFFWKYEKQIRLQAEKRLKTVSEQLVKSQADLAEAKQEAEAANNEKRFLIQQMGERDEHIRRLLAEMIKLLSGSGSVDLGEVMVRTQQPGAWDGVQNELRNITAQSPMSAGSAAAMMKAPAAGLRQVQVEQQAMPAVMQQAAIAAAPVATPAPTKFFDSLKESGAQVLTVNEQHRFVVLSQGSQNGLKQDSKFDLFAGDRKIGRVQIGTLYERISTASILEGDARSFREGSSVRLEPVSA